ncbi:unnamed protein product [Phyllotreta striolata]|uniref:PDZ domain-containing protein n=1 Tax=Phyllotreta striolata TaxID=444603 RepID=A0A9N9XNY0_PHYSR|nr:unnamed protein product [Phyllotreta striolata]
MSLNSEGDPQNIDLHPQASAFDSPVIQPRMAQLETLEAKMASIEVSLSSTPRRKKNGSVSGLSLSSSIQSIPKELAVKELEKLRNALRDKENIIQSLKGQLTIPGLRLNALRNTGSGGAKELTEVERKQAEARLSRLKTDIDNKRLTIKNLKIALERLDITDNIDVRIQQAELEYQLGREELNLLTLLEETRALQLCIEESNKNSSEYHTLYSCVKGNETATLQAIQLDYDVNNPKFGAGPKDSMPGLYVDWALEETNLCKGDRLIELNGKIVLNKSREDLNRLLAAAPDPAQIVVLRKFPENEIPLNGNGSSSEAGALRAQLESLRDRADEAQKSKEGFKQDNIRLTHRISYLEEQVSELLSRKPHEHEPKQVPPATSSISKSSHNVTNINIRTEATANQHRQHVKSKDKEDVCLPMRSKSSLSNVSNTTISTPNTDKLAYRKHHHHRHHRDSHAHREKDYSSETNSAVDPRHQRHHQSRVGYSADFARANSEKEYAGGSDVVDQSYKKATQIVQELTRGPDNRDALYEKHRRRCIAAAEKYNADLLRHYNARKSTSVLDFRSEIRIGPKNGEEAETKNGNTCRSVKSLDFDFDSDCNSTSNHRRTDYTSEPNNNERKSYYEQGSQAHRQVQVPVPPKKPLRLSLYKTRSFQSVEANRSSDNRKSAKRNHKGEATVADLMPQYKNGLDYQIKWNCRRSLDNNLENGSWC